MTAEKQVISNNTAVGVYYFKRGSDFVKYAEEMIIDNERVNNEFYLCPIYNRLIDSGLNVGFSEVEKMYVLGTPQDLDFYVKRVQPKFDDKPTAICCDHSGIDLKKSFIEFLESQKIKYIDFGTYSDKSCDYYDYTSQAIKAIKNNICDFGFAICRTGQGPNIASNKKDHIFSALIWDEYTAEYSIRHNCSNFFCIPSKYIVIRDMIKIYNKLKNSSFDGGRFTSRILKYCNDKT